MVYALGLPPPFEFVVACRPPPESPALHKCDETIRGHAFCSFPALVLKCELESRLRQSGLEWEWAEVIRALDSLHQVEATFRGGRFASLAGGRGGGSTDLTRAFVAKRGGSENVVPRPFCPYVSATAPTTQFFKP